MVTETTTLAGGCFWCIEAAFDSVEGIISSVSGYMGGDQSRANYKDVCRGDTGHAEVVQLTFDPSVIDYRDILEIFFTLHDPTQLNRQGGDVGTQYRSAIFPHNDHQREIAEEVIAELSGLHVWDKPIVTKIENKTEFYPAEEYHQGYFAQNPENMYCQAVVAPKLAKFRRNFVSRLKPELMSA